MTYYAPNFPPNGPANFPPNMRPVYRGGGEFPRSLFPSGTTGAWLDISDLSTLYQTNDTSTPVTALGQQVGRVTDKSGNGNHATQATASKRPTLQQLSNGAYALLFDGVDDFLVTPGIDFTGTDKMSLFFGGRKVDDTPRMICEFSGNVNTVAGTFYLSSGNDVDSARRWLSIARGTASANSAQAGYITTGSAPETAVISATHDISGDLSICRKNGVIGTNGTLDKGAGNFTSGQPLFIGARAGNSTFFNGYLSQLVVRGAMSSATEIAQMERFINQKIGAY